MKKIIALITVAATVALAGCSQPVPPAHKGKKLDPTGYAPDIYPPGRVNGFGPFSRSQLILIETGSRTMKETVTVKLKDRAELTFDLRFRTRIDGSDTVINSMFNDIVPVNNLVTLNMVYDTYGRMIVRNKAREVINDYSLEEINLNYDRISSEMAIEIEKSFKSIPLEMSDVALGNIRWPEEVTEAINAALKSKADIARIEADKAKEIASAQSRKAIADANYAADQSEARSVRDYNKTVGAGISEQFLRYKALMLQEKMIAQMGKDSGSKVVYMPYDAMGTMGAQMQMFGSQK